MFACEKELETEQKLQYFEIMKIISATNNVFIVSNVVDIMFLWFGFFV